LSRNFHVHLATLESRGGKAKQQPGRNHPGWFQRLVTTHRCSYATQRPTTYCTYYRSVMWYWTASPARAAQMRAIATHVARSAVRLGDVHSHQLFKNGGTDRDAVWGTSLCGPPKNYLLDSGPDASWEGALLTRDIKYTDYAVMQCECPLSPDPLSALCIACPWLACTVDKSISRPEGWQCGLLPNYFGHLSDSLTDSSFLSDSKQYESHQSRQYQPLSTKNLMDKH